MKKILEKFLEYITITIASYILSSIFMGWDLIWCFIITDLTTNILFYYIIQFFMVIYIKFMLENSVKEIK